MTVTDHDADAAEVVAGGDSRLSILGQLGKRRQEILDKEFLDLEVPRWKDPQIIIRYRPVPNEHFVRASDKIERAQPKDRPKLTVDVNTDVLIRGCVAVIARIGDGNDYSLRPGDPHGEPTSFDRDLAENLGLPDGATARQVVKELFLVDGDIMSHATALAQFSGYKEAEADDKVTGES